MRAFCVVTTRCSLATVSPSGGEGGEGTNSRRLTRIRFHLKTQLFRHGYGFCPHASHENDHWKRNFSKSSQEWNILTTLFSRVRMDGRNRNFSRMWRHTISANRPCAMLQTYSRWRAGVHFLVFTTSAYFTSNCLLSSKLSFTICSSWR